MCLFAFKIVDRFNGIARLYLISTYSDIYDNLNEECSGLFVCDRVRVRLLKIWNI